MAREKFQTLTEQMFYILLCLRQERCGADVMAWISETTHQRVAVGPGTLYNLLEQFLQAGYIRETKVEGRKRSYVITPAGREALEAEVRRLRQLTASGRLVRVGTKYYPAGQVVPPEEQYGVIREFLTQSGPAYRQDLAALLHIGDRQCALILKHMVEAGRLVRTGQRYALPVEEKAIL